MVVCYGSIPLVVVFLAVQVLDLVLWKAWLLCCHSLQFLLVHRIVVGLVVWSQAVQVWMV
jgi:hypothetical protein